MEAAEKPITFNLPAMFNCAQLQKLGVMDFADLIADNLGEGSATKRLNLLRLRKHDTFCVIPQTHLKLEKLEFIIVKNLNKKITTCTQKEIDFFSSCFYIYQKIWIEKICAFMHKKCCQNVSFGFHFTN